MLEARMTLPLAPEEWSKVDAVCKALADGCPKVSCVTCGGRVPIAFDVRRASQPAYAGPSLARGEVGGIVVVARRHERFCCFRCGMLFVQARLRRDGPRARLACAGFMDRRR